jgi:hypothetical protein
MLLSILAIWGCVNENILALDKKIESINESSCLNLRFFLRHEYSNGEGLYFDSKYESDWM